MPGPPLRALTAGHVPDADLLARFARDRDEAAFELLVWRHRRMVFDVCRRVAGNARRSTSKNSGAGEGNRTLTASLGSSSSAIELRPQEG